MMLVIRFPPPPLSSAPFVRRPPRPSAFPTVGEIVMTIPQDALIGRVEGTVFDHDGEPCRGAEVQVWRSFEDGSGRAGSSTKTDADGTFVLEDVPRRGVYLQVDGTGFADTDFSLRELGFEESDWATGGSDRLIDAICAWGDADTLRQKLDTYFEAGATHVALYSCNPDETYSPESPVSKNWNWPLLEAVAPAN